jgi:FkbM family methyltransferase
MISKIRRIIRKFYEIPNLLSGKGFISYSQIGEDRILAYLFNKYKIEKPTYLEIGTNHPVIGNNSYYFYLRGSRGVVIEPDPYYHSLIYKHRSNDKLYICGIAMDEQNEADFYIYPKKYSGWNTFSLNEVKVREKENINFERAIKVPLRTVNSILKENFNAPPDFLGIDVEGLDEEIIRSYDFENYAPKVICIEAIRFGDSKFVEIQNDLLNYIFSKGYELYANTNVNAIFVSKDNSQI